MKSINQQTTKQIGDISEDIAMRYLQNQGLRCIERNVTSRFGEIDLIMKDRNYLVFVEVKYRKSAQFGSAFAMVSHAKQQKIIKTAQLYMQKMCLNEYNTLCRFDVVSLEGSHQAPTINWLKDAFYGA